MSRSDHQLLKLKLVPGASSDEVVGWLDDRLKIRIVAAPEKGRANTALVAFLAQRIAMPRSAIRITAGHTSPKKTVTITGLSATELKTRLECLT